jgi:hypothetical protein
METAFLATKDLVNCFAKVPRPVAREKSMTLMDVIEELREVRCGSGWSLSTFHSIEMFVSEEDT